MMIRKRFSPFTVSTLFSMLALSACATTSGNYTVTVVNAQGKAIDAVFHVQGRHIYTVRNGICAAHSKAVVTIRLAESGKELQSESPYQCR